MPRSSRRSPCRRSPSPPGTNYSPLSSGNGRRSLHCRPPTRSFHGRPPTRSFHGRPPTRSSGNPNPKKEADTGKTMSLPAALSGSSRRSFPGRPPTRSSGSTIPQDPLPAVPATMSRSSRRSFPDRTPTYSSGSTNHQDPLPIVPATMYRSSRRLLFPGDSSCVLLDSYGYVFLAGDDKDATGYGLVVGDDNNTTAQTFTTDTGTIKVTFVIADLPGLSYFYVRCLDLSVSPFDSEPEIVCSTENLVLLSLDISTCSSPEYFIYRAGLHGCPPSLDPLPDICKYFARWNIDPHLVGILPDGGGTDFVLAAFTTKSGKYKLHIFKSRQNAWTTELLVPDLPCWLTRNGRTVSPDKVIALQGGLLGFVDLWKGILLCNVLKEPVTVDFVPLPKLLPTNREHYDESLAWPIRDVTCTDGSIIRCVELEDIYRVKTRIPDASTKDVFLDSEAVDPTEEEVVEEFVGWRLITWFREVSWYYWRKGSVSHVDELRTVYLPHPDYGCDRAAEFLLKTCKTSCPTVCGDDIVCLMSKNNPHHDASILTVDMRSKTVGEPVPFHVKTSRHSNTTYIPCSLNKYLNRESDKAQVGLQSACSDRHFPLEQNSSKYSSTFPQQKRRRLLRPYTTTFESALAGATCSRSPRQQLCRHSALECCPRAV